MDNNQKIFKYPFLFRVVFRYGNIPATIILSFYLVIVVLNIDKQLIYILPLVITLLMIYFLNRGYLNLYKLMPFSIEADDEKLYCSDFIFSKKEVTIFFKDIESLSGGIYDGTLRGMMKVCDGKNKICIGYYNKIKNSKTLNTIILSKITRPVYDEVLRKTGINNPQKNKNNNKKKSS